MIYDPETDPHLKSWLVKNLEPICDAEPGALADYILALLKHPASEPDLRKELVSQLEEFLEKETTNFIDLLFNALRSKSYLPYAASPPRTYPLSGPSGFADSGIPIPLDALTSSTSRKRGLEHLHDEHEYRKGPRLSNDPQVSRYGSAGRGSAGPVRGGRGGYGSEGGASGVLPYQNGRPQQTYRGPEVKKGVCRDYHNYGYCSRGASCKYSHGEDAVVPSQLLGMPSGMMPFMSMMNNAMFPGANGGAYDPHERIDMRQPPRQPMMHRQDVPYPSSAELPVVQDLTPRMPTDKHQNGYPPTGNGLVHSNPSRMDVDTDSYRPDNNHFQPSSNYRQNNRPSGGFRGGGRRGARPMNEPGVFPMAVDDLPLSDNQPSTSSNPPQFPTSAPRPERRNDKTLVVEKIPEEHLALGAVNDWFKRFGTVTNVAVDVKSAKALVSFSDHEEAHKAWKSEDAVFGNRFVKVFWHRPMGGHGTLGAKMLKASAPLVSKLSTETNGSDTPMSITPAEPKKPAPSSAVSALAAKQQLLKQQIVEQKTLMAKLESAGSPEEKKEIMGRLRKLGEEMKPSSTNTASSSASGTPAPSTARASAPPSDQELVERERLDKELEIHAATTVVDREESTEDLKAKLEKLKAEAASLGLPEADPSYPSYTAGSQYRPYRGRARGAARGGYFARGGRGGPPRASMKLDNRPKKLLLKGVNDEGVQTVRDWYATTGLVDTVETVGNGEVLVSFKTRGGAEQGFAKGSNVPTVGQVEVSWYTNQPPASSRPPPPATAAAKQDTSGNVEHPIHSENHGEEEEMVASGWGDDNEDGMGML